MSTAYLTYSAPYFVPKEKPPTLFRKRKYPPLSLALTEKEMPAYTALIGHIVDWCIRNKLASPRETGQLTIHLGTDRYAMGYLLYTTNFSNFVDTPDDVHTFTLPMTSGPSPTPIEQIINLAAILYAHSDPTFINAQITRVYRGLAAVRGDWESWCRFHVDNPYYWLVILIHQVMHLYGMHNR